MCNLKKVFVILTNFFLCCLSLAGIGLLVYRSHEEGLLTTDALQQQKLNIPMAEGCLLIVVIIVAMLGIIGIAKRSSPLLFLNSVLLQLLLLAEVALCGYYTGYRSGSQNFVDKLVSKLSEVIPVGQPEQTFTIDVDLESETSISIIVIVALQILVQELSIVWTWIIAFKLKYYVGEIPEFRNLSYRPVKKSSNRTPEF